MSIHPHINTHTVTLPLCTCIVYGSDTVYLLYFSLVQLTWVVPFTDHFAQVRGNSSRQGSQSPMMKRTVLRKLPLHLDVLTVLGPLNKAAQMQTQNNYRLLVRSWQRTAPRLTLIKGMRTLQSPVTISFSRCSCRS